MRRLLLILSLGAGAWLLAGCGGVATVLPSPTAQAATATASVTSTAAVPLPTTTEPPAAATAASPDAAPATPTGAPTGTAVPGEAPSPTVEDTPTATPLLPTATVVVAPTAEPTQTLAPTATPEPTPTPAPALPSTPDPAVGQQVFLSKPCVGCHGEMAEGIVGPKLAGTGLTFDQVLLRVRTGKDPMPAFPPEQVSDLEVQHIYAWLRSLAPPTPTPVAAASFPTGALMAMWQNVNDMKVSSDFAKDLPARQAGDDAGRLAILKQYAEQARQQGQAALAQADQVLAQAPGEAVRASVTAMAQAVNEVMAEAGQALALGSYGEAWPHAAAMVRLSRLDAWPLATEAVRRAGLVGALRVRVTDQAGRAIPQAFVTVLTAHTPVGARVDGTGRATISNVAAVPALQVKAYSEGLVYHEVHVNLSPGATTDVTIVLPAPSASGQAPSVSGAALEPASGSGGATITLSLTATDPQGAGDLAEDQIFALSGEVGLAYILRHVGGDRYSLQLGLPNLGAGLYTWYFFAVDHECNTSNVLTATYEVR